jgi:anti-anti-sigma regulatory factor
MIEIREESTSASASAVVVRCSEYSGSAGVMRCVDLALRLGQRRLVVDLGARDGADADLLSVLHRSGKRMRAAGGRLGVVCYDSGLRRLLDLTLLSQGFAVYATREEALAG